MKLTKHMLQNQASSTGTSNGGGATPPAAAPPASAPAAPAATPPVATQPPATAPAATPPAASPTDFYNKGQAPTEGNTPKAGAGDKKPEPPKAAEPEKIKDPVTGYGKEPVKPAEPPAEPLPVVEPPKNELGYELKTDGLPDDQAKMIREYAKDLELTEDKAKLVVDKQLKLHQANVAAQTAADQKFKQEQDTAKQNLRAQWDTELRNCPTFGKEKFDHNVHLAEKVLARSPEWKKALTERGSMLPPYIMRLLAEVGGELYGQQSQLNNGDPGLPAVPQKKEGEKNDPLAFYNKKV